jgi:omega-6 fatty acid desaturase (delta-12 desaturase)
MITISTLLFVALSFGSSFYFNDKNIFLFLLSTLIAGGFVIKSFIIMHDCGHGTFFEKKSTRDFIGKIFSYICFTPYFQWANDHAIHHQTSGNLGKRGWGDVWTMTVKEYEQATRFEKFQYLAYRNPFIMCVIGGFYLFFIRFRIPQKRDDQEAARNVTITTLVISLYFLSCFYFFGIAQTLITTLLIYTVATATGTFLFYIQHQYEECYWRQDKEWDYTTAALAGSSYFKLPAILQWFTGSIGFHHIHHLNHRIPFYNLEKCYLENDCFQNVKTLGIWEACKTYAIKFYDEEHEKMITMAQFKKLRKRNKLTLQTAS